jgi:hypothetical protein
MRLNTVCRPESAPAVSLHGCGLTLHRLADLASPWCAGPRKRPLNQFRPSGARSMRGRRARSLPPSATATSSWDGEWVACS